MLFNKFRLFTTIHLCDCRIKFCQQFATSRSIVKLNDNVENDLENEVYKPRGHPGIQKDNAISIPSSISKILERVIGDHPIKPLWKDGQKLTRYLKARHIPPEKGAAATDSSKLNPLYNWKAIDYDAYKSLCYLVGRSAQEYATIHKIFSEIHQRHPAFKPQSFFDFGSGIGTGLWSAATIWKNLIYEYYLVDVSRHMNDLSQTILADAQMNEIDLRTIFHRQFLPASTIQYDIVLCAYSLFELPDAKSRAEVLMNLWNRCSGYLIVIEHGTRAGFSLINEARNMILTSDANNIHSFSPCPHDNECPRIALNDGTPCNFVTTYLPLPFERNNSAKHELYSYIVLRKNSPNGMNDDATEHWPRLVRPTLVRKKHSICRMCTKNGDLQEIIFTPTKHSKTLYRCAKASSWGDRLPISIEKSTTS